MPSKFEHWIHINDASEHNLKSISLKIPKYALTVVTGVSGSGKSSLVFDTLFREAEKRYLATFSIRAQHQIGKIRQPDVESISNLSPAIAVSQKRGSTNARSTVGTLSGIYDLLRLLFARLGKEKKQSNLVINRSLFSFNSHLGACPSCKGIGKQDQIDPELLIVDANKSIRDRCLKITAPNGYIIYSQVTIDVLNEVCQVEGFDVDIPWKDLTEKQKAIIWYGSTKIKIPFGKHPLESRMKWQGITAKPREEGFYRGILPIMNEILKRDRNPNILRFSKTIPCPDCDGSRLSPTALNVYFQNNHIADLSKLSINDLHQYFESLQFEGSDINKGQPIQLSLLKKMALLRKLGLGYLKINRDNETLSGGEIQRIRIANQVNSKLCGVIYIFDEPSAGLHYTEINSLIQVMRQLVQNGNTVIAVAHEATTIKNADYLIDIGPGPGKAGGEIVFEGTIDTFFKHQYPKSLTWKYLNQATESKVKKYTGKESEPLILPNSSNQLKKVPQPVFKNQAINTITGISGSGKSLLLSEVFLHFNKTDTFDKVVSINSSPIGRTPRSNPATYIKLFDVIRQIFANTDLAREKKYKKNRFSFNVKGGRCEACQGAGVIQTGMHFLDNVEILCDECHGKRFNSDTLAVSYAGKNISDVLNLSVDESAVLFANDPKAIKYITTLQNLGLGYIKLGQNAISLSGGEAQRIKLAAELSTVSSGKSLYLLEEPCSGLHFHDVTILLQALQQLKAQGNTIIVIENSPDFIAASDFVFEIGKQTKKSIKPESAIPDDILLKKSKPIEQIIKLEGVKTHNLKDISIAIQPKQLVVFTGVSGSGKSSLVFDTLFAQCKTMFAENFSPYLRSQMQNCDQPKITSYSGLSPAIAIHRKRSIQNPRSTVGTITGLYEYYRLLFARCGENNGKNNITSESTLFSFNQKQGACPECVGLGWIKSGDPTKLISNPEKSILSGAMSGHKPGCFFSDPDGQYIAALKKVGDQLKLDFNKPFKSLTTKEKEIILYGTGEDLYDVDWQYSRKGRKGNHQFQTSWPGFIGHIETDYQLKKNSKRADILETLMQQKPCASCDGNRLNNEALSYQFGGHNIAELSALSIKATINFFENISTELTPVQIKKSKQIRSNCTHILKDLADLGLEYLQINRTSDSLSGGEYQRVQLAGQLSSGLTDIIYILDEPTIGLHPRDTENLKNQLIKLKNQGNTVLVVEHDEDIIQNANLIVDMGPGAGLNGGEILAMASPEKLKQNPKSVTAPYLLKHPCLKNPNQIVSVKALHINGANANNLKKIDFDIPINQVVTVAGVSGSGKSSLLNAVIADSAKLNQPVNCQEITGLNNFDNIILADQKPLSNNPLSSLATYIGVFDAIRTLFANTDSAKNLGYKKTHFSYNSKAGRCNSCQGNGKVKTKLDFLADVWNRCETCQGKRFKSEILQVKFNGKSIFEILDQTVSAAMTLFAEHKPIFNYLKILKNTGLGYIKLGQSISELSGGEAQRLKLAVELTQNKGKNLYLFDEPFTGLHFKDAEKLMRLFYQLQQDGHSIIMIEHNSWVIASSDWVIDLGSQGGENGGEIIAEGTPETVSQHSKSVTACYLKKFF